MYIAKCVLSRKVLWLTLACVIVARAAAIRDKESLTLVMLNTISHVKSPLSRSLKSALSQAASRANDMSMSWHKDYKLQTRYFILF